jgi:hypothetical protein
MIENTIGNKKEFAIEYEIQKVNPSPPYGSCLIWISELSLGDIENPIFLTSAFFISLLIKKKKISLLQSVVIYQFL